MVNRQFRNGDLCGADNYVLIANSYGVFAGFSVITGIQRPCDIRIVVRKCCFADLIRRNDHIDSGFYRRKSIRRRGSGNYRIFQRTRKLCIFGGSL